MVTNSELVASEMFSLFERYLLRGKIPLCSRSDDRVADRFIAIDSNKANLLVGGNIHE